jgi:hypothetical protein
VYGVERRGGLVKAIVWQGPSEMTVEEPGDPGEREPAGAGRER